MNRICLGAGILFLLAGLKVSSQEEATIEVLKPLKIARYDHTATLLADGTVLIAGGYGGYKTCEIYTPGIGPSPAASMAVARSRHWAILLTDGRVLVIGGSDPSTGDALASCEIYDPVKAIWKTTSSLSVPRMKPIAARLGDGRVLVAGGADDNSNLGSAEIFDPATETWKPAASMDEARYWAMSETLSDGRLLVVGGSGGANSMATREIYNPAADGWKIGSAPLANWMGALNLQEDGSVLMAGGMDDMMEFHARCFLFDPTAQTWSETGKLNARRAEFPSVVLSDGRTFVCGGYDGTMGNTVYLSTTEVYDPGTKGWIFGPKMADAKKGHTATLLPDGKVLICGGWVSFANSPSGMTTRVERVTFPAAPKTSVPPGDDGGGGGGGGGCGMVGLEAMVLLALLTFGIRGFGRHRGVAG